MSLAIQPEPKHDVPGLVEGNFRRSFGGLIARLVSRYGAASLPMAEEAVQEAMIAALRAWPVGGVPDAPEAWLATVARNRMIDALRRDSRVIGLGDAVPASAETVDGSGAPARGETPAAAGFPAATDTARPRVAPSRQAASQPPAAPAPPDRLDLLMLICSAGISVKESAALSLKVVFGFGVREVARLVGDQEKTVEVRLYRARKKLRDRGFAGRGGGAHDSDFPTRGVTAAESATDTPRFTAVLEVIYAAFTQGFIRPLSPSPIQVDLATECISLLEAVIVRREWDDPASHALLALLYLQASRIPARIAEGSITVELDRQDRSLWRRDWIRSGMKHLDASMQSSAPTRYHHEAAIAACYASTIDGGSPPWSEIISLHDTLLEIADSETVRLNRAIAIGEAGDPETALHELEMLRGERPNDAGFYFHAARARFLAAVGRKAEALDELDRGARQTTDPAENAFAKRKMRELKRLGEASD